MMKKIVVATNNFGKLKEIKEILKDYELVSFKDLNLKVDIIENGKTFKENALKKAREVFKITDIPSIADDSGLCIDSLKGFPGINTARFLGDNATDDDRNNYILEKMKDKNEKGTHPKARPLHIMITTKYYYSASGSKVPGA